MKTLILLFALLFAAPEQNDFCTGYREGYDDGWCYHQEFGCIRPLPPLCPLPEINRNTYKHGYNRGFLQGKRDYEKTYNL
jgi:hypothetical protein